MPNRDARYIARIELDWIHERTAIGRIHSPDGEPISTGAQAQHARIPLADGTLVATPDLPPDDLIPSLLSASEVLGTGWFGAVAALCIFNAGEFVLRRNKAS